MEILAIGSVLLTGFALALSLQWGILALIVRRLHGPGDSTSAPRAGAS